MNFHQPPDLDFSIIFQVAKKRAFLITKTIDFDRFWSKSGNPRFGYENIRISYDFQVAKKRAFLITKTIDFDRFLIQIRKS